MKNRRMCIKRDDAGFFGSVGIGIRWEFTQGFLWYGMGTGLGKKLGFFGKKLGFFRKKSY